jgi:DNA polymerase III subunit beta
MVGKFTVDQKVLISLLSSMQPICTKRTTIDATTYILFQIGHKELVLKSTDLEISLQVTCAIFQSTFGETYSFLVPGKRIFDLVKELDGTIEFAVDKQLSLKAGSAHLSLNIKDAQDFPPFPERIENLTQLEASFLISLLNKVAFLIPQNNTNPSLNGLFLELSAQGLTMTTTDGHCLAQIFTAHYTLEENKQWLLPRRAIFEIFLGICGNQLVFSGEAFNFFTKLLTDQFPQYRSILKKEDFIPALIDREPFIKALRRSACLLSGQFLATRFGFEKDAVHISMENKEIGKLDEALSLRKFDGPHIDIRFYAPYLLSGLQSFEQKEIVFYLKNTTKPIIFEAQSSEYNLTYLVMPVSPTTT